ncbi:MAG: DUF2508 family protein [Cellulosilyticaceae bacterium]
MKKKAYREQLQKQKEEADILAREVNLVQNEMAATMNNFSGTTDPELLEYYTYYYKANEIKHGYLLRKLKQIYYAKVK